MKININNTKFLNKSEDIQHKDIVTLQDEGTWEESTRFQKPDGSPSNIFKINIKLANGEIRNTSLSWTNIQLLVKGLGDETSEWVGKEVRAWKTKSERAKAGFTYIFVPTDWVRNDIGEWEVDGKSIDTEIVEIHGHKTEEIDPDSIPF